MTDKPDTKIIDPETQTARSPFVYPEERQDPIKAAQAIVTVPPPPVVAPKLPTTSEKVIGMLLNLPDEICRLQAIYDTAQALYEVRLSDLSFKALNTMMFSGKKEGEPLRIASNDEERKIATSQVITGDEKMLIIKNDLDEAIRELQHVKNLFEGAKIAAHLLGASK